MKPRHWFCTISIFLCAVFTADAQALEAVEWERVLYQGASPAEANRALISRTEALIELGRWEDAVDAMDRVRMFALSKEDALTANLLQGIAHYRMGDYSGAAGFLAEGFPDTERAAIYRVLILAGNRKWPEAEMAAIELRPDMQEALQSLFRKTPVLKKPGTAAMLSLLPPLGHAYLVDKDWFWPTIMSYGGAALTVWQVVEGNYLTGLLGGGMLLNASYMEKNIATAPERAAAVNEESLKAFLANLESIILHSRA